MDTHSFCNQSGAAQSSNEPNLGPATPEIARVEPVLPLGKRDFFPALAQATTNCDAMTINTKSMNSGQPEKATRILVIDDNQAVHEAFTKILSGKPESLQQLETVEASVFGR